MTCQIWTWQKNPDASSAAQSHFVRDVCSEALVVQIQVHISKYRCSADRISNMNKINFTLFGNQVTKLLISTMTHNCFQIPFLYIKPFNWNYWFRVRTHWALPSLSFLLNLLIEATHYSTCQSCKVCEISFPCFQRSPKYPTDTKGIPSFPGLYF